MTFDYRRLSPFFLVLVRKRGIGQQYQGLHDSAPRLAMRAPPSLANAGVTIRKR
jgi:hypothetical protein